MGKPPSTGRPPGKARQPTRDLLLDAAGHLLGEVGMERISTNLICERAGVTPPTLYHYFGDKFAIIVALGERLMARQNEALARWTERYAAGGMDAYADHIAELLRETAEITEADPGGVWIERALHSSPRLEAVRIESHRFVTGILTSAFAPHLPGVAYERIWLRVRMVVEFGYAAIELLHSETGIARETILAETAHLQKTVVLDLLS